MAQTLRDKLRAGVQVVTVEIDPPRGADASRMLTQVDRLKGRADAVNVADSPMANLRMAPIAAAYLIQRELGVETIFHLTCRDRNLLGLQAELLGASALGVRNLLALTGDHPGRGNHPTASSVFDLDVSGLVGLANRLNTGRDHTGNELEGGSDFLVGVVCNPCAPDRELELAKLGSKVRAGAHFVQTQPVFDLERLKPFAEAAARFGVPILYGVLPLARYRSARYLRDQAGMVIPDRVLEQVEAGGREAGLEIALGLAAKLREQGQGLHVFPYRDFELAWSLLERLRAG